MRCTHPTGPTRPRLVILHVAHGESLQGEYPLGAFLREAPPLPPAFRRVLGIIRENVLDHLPRRDMSASSEPHVQGTRRGRRLRARTETILSLVSCGPWLPRFLISASARSRRPGSSSAMPGGSAAAKMFPTDASRTALMRASRISCRACRKPGICSLRWRCENICPRAAESPTARLSA